MLDFATEVHVCKDQAMFTTLQKDGDFGCINVGKKLKLKVEGMEELARSSTMVKSEIFLM